MLALSVRPAYSCTLIGDVNGDGKVDMKDLVIAGQAFGSYPEHPRWNPQADVNSDGKVDMKDLCIIASHFGDTLNSNKIKAKVKICPRVLNLCSRGRWIIAFIELPEGYNPADINVSSVMLNGTIRAEPKPVCIRDFDCDGAPELIVKFDRRKVIDLILSNYRLCRRFTKVTLTVTGNVNSDLFEGSDTVKVIKRCWFCGFCSCSKKC
jgi:hypothetical protein